MFFGDGCIVLMYVDDVILVRDTTSKIDSLVLSVISNLVLDHVLNLKLY